VAGDIDVAADVHLSNFDSRADEGLCHCLEIYHLPKLPAVIRLRQGSRGSAVVTARCYRHPMEPQPG